MATPPGGHLDGHPLRHPPGIPMKPVGDRTQPPSIKIHHTTGSEEKGHPPGHHEEDQRHPHQLIEHPSATRSLGGDIFDDGLLHVGNPLMENRPELLDGDQAKDPHQTRNDDVLHHPLSLLMSLNLNDNKLSHTASLIPLGYAQSLPPLSRRNPVHTPSTYWIL